MSTISLIPVCCLFSLNGKCYVRKSFSSQFKRIFMEMPTIFPHFPSTPFTDDFFSVQFDFELVSEWLKMKNFRDNSYNGNNTRN